MSEFKVFKDISDQSLNFYNELGFVHHRVLDDSHIKLTKEAFQYYSTGFKPKSVAFRNSEGIPRHAVDIFRDKKSPALNIFLDVAIQKILNFYLSSDLTYIFTHSKMSFKQPWGGTSDWNPHQDNGYKNEKDVRDGFAIFLCLEDMNKANGALQVYAGSHKFGKLEHIKISENSKYGDHQYVVRKIPDSLTPFTIDAKQGDIVLFHSNLIHQSASSSSDSKRLSFIAEVEEWDNSKLDDYAKIPILSNGETFKLPKKINLLLKSISSKQFYLNKVSDYPKVVSLLRRIKGK